jgi:hypothetical protein
MRRPSISAARSCSSSTGLPRASCAAWPPAANRAPGRQDWATATGRHSRPRPCAVGRSGGFADRPERACRSGLASGHLLTATAGRAAAAAWESTLPPSFIQRSASRPASARGASAAGRTSRPPAMTRSAVLGTSSPAHFAPQRQQPFSWRAIGALQEPHTRGKCRSRIAQRSFPERASPVRHPSARLRREGFRRWRENRP